MYGLFRHLVPQSLGSCLRYIRDMEKVVELESGGNAAGCGHEVVTVLSRIREEERGGGGEGFVTLSFNKSHSYKRLSFNYY